MLAFIKINNYKGIWFFGLSGVGKSYASNLIKAKHKNTVVIDGDVVQEEKTDLMNPNRSGKK